MMIGLRRASLVCIAGALVRVLTNGLYHHPQNQPLRHMALRLSQVL